MTDIKVDLLKYHKEHIKVLARWLYNEFARENENLDFFEALLENGAGDASLPKSFIAFADNKPAGCVCLWRSDLMTRQDIYPWLAVLFVTPEFRGLHVGRELQNRLLVYAKNVGYDEVYLYTDLDNYYEKTGWSFAGYGIESDGSSKKLYKYNLGKMSPAFIAACLLGGGGHLSVQ